MVYDHFFFFFLISNSNCIYKIQVDFDLDYKEQKLYQAIEKFYKNLF